MSKQIETVEKQIEASTKELAELKALDFDDKLDRRKLAKNFVSVLTSQNANVFSINGGWGTGKTWFLKFVEDVCEQDGIPFIQYNVWETDYLNNPFKALVSEIIDLLNKAIDIKAKENPKLKSLKNEIEPIRLKAEKILQKCTFSAQVTTPSLGGTIPTVSAGVSYDPNKISEYEALKDLKKDFDKQLKATIQELNVPEIVIAIDELDRCRPDYAIRTLEIIKHFFNIKGIKFILAVDKGQLANTVKALYGQDADTDCYLRKFVDLEYNLPDTPKDEYIDYLIQEKFSTISKKIISFGQNKRILYLGVHSWSRESAFVLGASDARDVNYARNSIKSILEKSTTCLREIEKCLLRLSIVLDKLSESKDFLEIGFLLQLIIINLKNPNMFNELNKLTLVDSATLNFYEHFNIIQAIVKNKISGGQGYREEKYDGVKASALVLYKYYDLINLSEGF